MATQNSEILEIIENLPGCTSKQICDLAPHIKFSQIHARLTVLFAQGKISRVRIPNPDTAQIKRNKVVWSYTIGSGKPPINPKLIKKNEYRNDPCILEELEELRHFKIEAIKRYPELAIAPEMLVARQVAYDYYMSIKDTDHARKAKAGLLDNTPVIQIAVRAAES